MVNVRPQIRNSVHNVISPRIVPKTTRTIVPTATQPTSGSGTTSTTTTTTTTATTPASDPAADFRKLFSTSAPPTPVTPAPAPSLPANPTLQSVFGSNAFVSNPGGVAPNGVTYSYNPMYFATRATADKLAQMYGGSVVEQNAITPYGPFQQNQMNEMIRFSNGNVVNAGILASYYNMGLSQAQINQAISSEINNIPT